MPLLHQPRRVSKHTRPSSPLSIRRTSCPTNALISPFLLDFSSITLSSNTSSPRQPATWLHLPVTLRFVPTRPHALSAVAELSALRHPNVEQLLGAVPAGPRGPCLVTERVPGLPLSARLSHAPFVRAHALALALDLARALVYIHVRARRPHAAVRPDNVLFDDTRRRAVLLLADQPDRHGRFAAPELVQGRAPEFQSDVYSLAAVVRQMFAALRAKGKPDPFDAMPANLAPVVRKALRTDFRKRPSMEQLCQALTDCVQADR